MGYVKRATEMNLAELRAAIIAAQARFDTELSEDLEIFQVPKENPNRRQFEELVVVPPKRFRTPSFSTEEPEVYAKLSGDGASRAYGYARVSTTMQYDRDNSIPDQRIRMEHYFKFQLESQGIRWEGVTDDGQGKSARLRPFMTRPGVAKMVRLLNQGDHVIIDKFDRAFRDTRDFLHCAAWFDRNKINLHVLNLGGQNFQPNSPIGRMFMTMLAGFAQLESETISARIKDATKAARMKGLATAGFPPGTKPIARDGRRWLVWDVPKRRYMALIVYMRDELYMDWRDITWELFLLRSGGKPPTTDKDRMRWANNQQKPVYELYCYEHFYRDKCVTDPAEIPYKATVQAYGAIRKKENTKIIRAYRGATGLKDRKGLVS